MWTMTWRKKKGKRKRKWWLLVIMVLEGEGQVVAAGCCRLVVKWKIAVLICRSPSSTTGVIKCVRFIPRRRLWLFPGSGNGSVSNAAGSMSYQSLMRRKGAAGVGWPDTTKGVGRAQPNHLQREPEMSSNGLCNQHAPSLLSSNGSCLAGCSIYLITIL